MEQEKKREWRGGVGWALLILGVIERVVGVGGSIDFVLTRTQDPAWVGTVFKFALTNVGLAMVLAGVAFIVWNERRHTERLLEARVGGFAPPIITGSDDSKKANRDHNLQEVYKTLGQAINSDSRLAYDLAMAGCEAYLLGLSRENDLPIPELRADGTPAGIYRMLAYFNEIMAALQLDDLEEAQARARRIVPILNRKSAQDLHEEMGLPNYSMPPE